MLEALEPRLLLSADISYLATPNIAVTDLTLKAEQDNSQNLFLNLYDTSLSKVQSVALNSTNLESNGNLSINITGLDTSTDNFHIDLNTFSVLDSIVNSGNKVNINFEGGSIITASANADDQIVLQGDGTNSTSLAFSLSVDSSCDANFSDCVVDFTGHDLSVTSKSMEFTSATSFAGLRNYTLNAAGSITETGAHQGKLNDLIGAVLNSLNTASLPTGAFVSTAGDPFTVGKSSGNKAELELFGGVTLVFSNLSYDAGNSKVIGEALVEANNATLFPEGIGLVIEPDINGGDPYAAYGTINLSNQESTLHFDKFDATALGWPSFLMIDVTDMRMTFSDFRANDSATSLKLDGDFKGFDTGLGPVVNGVINALLKVNGSASNVEFDLDKLGQATGPLTGLTALASIKSLDGIAGEIVGKLPGVGTLGGGFILKKIGIDANGQATNDSSLTVQSVYYAAVTGILQVGSKKVPTQGPPTQDGTPPAPVVVPEFLFDFNLAISDYGPLQLFVKSSAHVPLGTTGLVIDEMSGGVRFNSTIEGLQIRDPYVTSEGSAQESGDLQKPVEITLKIPDNTFRVGDEFRITDAVDPDFVSGAENFIVTRVDGEEISYLTTGLTSDYTFGGDITVKKITISAPEDLKDPGFQSTSELTITQWEQQLDAQVVAQAQLGFNAWNVFNTDWVFELGARVVVEGVKSFFVNFDAHLLLDTQGEVLLSGEMRMAFDQVKVPVKIFANVGDLGSGNGELLFLAEMPEVPGDIIKPVIVIQGSVRLESLINGLPAALDGVGLPEGVGVSVSSATVTDLDPSTNGTGPWQVTFALDMPAGAKVSDQFAVGDTLVAASAAPGSFDGKYTVIGVDDANSTVSYRVGAAVVNSGIDINLDGVITSADNGTLGGVAVIGGALDFNGDGVIDASDIGEVSTVINGVVVGYKVIEGKVDINGNNDVNADSGDVGVIGKDPGVWTPGTFVANENQLGNGFRISLDGQVDLNIPLVTTLTLKGSAGLDFTTPGPGSPEDVRLDMSYIATLSETNVGNIGSANGKFHVTVDGGVPVDSTHPMGGVEIWGASLLTTNFDFLQKVGLYANANGLLRINSSNVDKPAESLLDVNNHEVLVDLPAESFALRLDGSVDFRIDYNGDHTFAPSESAFSIDGTFVLEFSAAQGFNIAVFRDDGTPIPKSAKMEIGPKDKPLLEVGVLGFLAVRTDGFAADLFLTADANLPGDLAHITADAVFVVNSTGRDVSFTIPGGGADPNNPTGLTLTIPKAAPSDPSGILNDPAKFDALKHGDTSWQQVSAGPYGVVFIKGGMKMLSVLQIDVSGYVLLSADVVSMELNFAASGNFLNLASASANGTIFFSSEGEFYLDVHGHVQLGPDWINIHGDANLTISYLDNNGRATHGNGVKKLDVAGNLSVGATLFGADIGHLDLTVNYKNDNITVGVPYPEPYWAKACKWGICVYYPSVRTAHYQMTVGTLSADPEPPPPPVLGQVDGNGVLTLNVGPNAGARKLHVDEVNEDVSIESLGGNRIKITMFGYSQTFDNVTSILIDDMGAGDDVVTIGSSVTKTVTINHFGEGDDTLRNYGSGVVIAHGDAGDDSLQGGAAGDYLYGDDGEDYIDGGGGNDYIDGGGDEDTLIGGGGSDTILGGLGNDLIIGDLATVQGDENGIVFESQASAIGDNDTIHGGDGADIILGGSGSDIISGDAGDDQLYGDDGKVTLTDTTSTFTPYDLGSSGDDRMIWAVGDGSDIIDGQSGNDTLDITASDGSPLSIGAKGAGFMAVIGPNTLSVDGIETSNVQGRSGSDTFAVNDLTGSTLQQVNLKLGSDSASDAVAINGSNSGEAFTISAIGGTLRVQKAGGVTVDIFDANAASGGDIIALDTSGGADIVDVLGTLAGTFTNVNTGSGNDTVNVKTTSGETTINSGADQDTVNVQMIGAAMTVNAGSGNDIINVGSMAPLAGGKVNGIASRLTVRGEEGDDTLNVDNTGASADTGTLSATELTGLGMASGIGYETLEHMNIALGNEGDTFTIASTHTGTTTLFGNGGDDIVNVRTIDGTTNIFGGDGSDTFNVGGNAAGVAGDAGNNYGGTVNGINAQLTIDGNEPTSGSDVVNIDDTGDTDPNTGMLTATTLTGLGMGGGIAYGTTEHLNIGLGSGDDTFTIESTHAGTTTLDTNAGSDTINVQTISGETTINAGEGDDIINVGSLAPVAGGTTGGIAAPLTINGQGGSDTLSVDDTGDSGPGTLNLTADTIEGLGMSGSITYDNLEDLYLGLGSGGNSLNIRSVGASTSINAGSGDDSINVGSLAPGMGGTLNGISACLTLNGQCGNDALNVDDSGDSADSTGTLAATSLTGLGMSDGIHYTNMEALEISLGSGNDSFDVLGTMRQNDFRTITMLNTGDGNDQVTVALDAATDGQLAVNLGEGNDMLDASASTLGLIVFGGLGSDVIIGGAGADTIFGDRGEVDYYDAGGLLVTRLGIGPVERSTDPFAANFVPGKQTDGVFGEAVTSTMRDAQSGGDDTLFGGLGDDGLWGGAGNDVMLGGIGQVTREYDAGGALLHTDVLLLDEAYISGSIALAGADVPCGDINTVNSLLNSDVTLLAGAFNADGSRLLNADGSWATQALLLTLVRDGNDVMCGGDGNDALFGQRGDDMLNGDAGNDFIAGGTGNDAITGGDGSDTLVGDDALIVSSSTEVPNVTCGFLVMHTADSVEANLGIDLGTTGTTIVPMLDVAPGSGTNAASLALPQLFGSDAIPVGNSLPAAAGASLIPYASVITDFGHHLGLLNGNDNVSGGDGNDTLVGDGLSVIAPEVAIDAASMLRAETITSDLLGISDAFSEMVHHQHGLFGSPSDPGHGHDQMMIDNVFSIGEDILDGGAGNDVLIGDDSTLFAPSITLPVNLSAQFESFVNGLSDAGDAAGEAVLDLGFLAHQMRDTTTQVQLGRHLYNMTLHHVDLVMMGNDVIYGGDGNDYIVGDNFDARAPIVTLTAAESGAINDDHYDKDGRDDAIWWRSSAYSDHHDDRADQFEVGADAIYGGSGNDLIWGDNKTIAGSTVIRGSGIGNRDFFVARHEVGEGLERLNAVADKTDSWVALAGRDHDHGYGNYNWSHDSDRELELSRHHDSDHGDTVFGGDGNDIIFGQDGNDMLQGDAGDDWLIGGEGKDLLDGGSGRDKVYQGENDSAKLQELAANATPLINWSGLGGSFFDAADRQISSGCASAWLNDFLNHAGKSETQRDPNSSLKVWVG